ncbi:MAG: putative glycoside hydrolase [Gemmatimonadota bacterium]
MSGSSQEQLKSPVRVTFAAVALVMTVFALHAARGADEAAAQGAAQPAIAADTGALPALRGLYLNRFAVQSGARMRRLIAMADSTEINAFVLDMKDEFGLNYRSSNPKVQRNAGAHGAVRNVGAIVDTLKAHGITPIARVVAFKDPIAASQNPEWTIRTEDSSAWRDKESQVWVNAFHADVWEHNLSVAEELAKMGFVEIQFDYIRFPEPYASLPKQVFPGAKGTKADALTTFLVRARERLAPLGVRSTADVFGLATTARGTLEVGQNWERLSPVVDVILPMVYPSHYPRGAFGVPLPNADPYAIVKTAVDTARSRDVAMGLVRGDHVRAWLQAFTLGRPPYGVEEIKAQKRAVYDAGYGGWILWNPASNYDLFAAALEPKAQRP